MTSNSDEKKTYSIIGALLMEEGVINQQDLQRAVEIQSEESECARLPMGLILVKKGLMSEEDLATLQNHPDFQDEIESKLIEDGWITEQELAVCQEKLHPPEQLKDVLLREGYLSAKDFEIVLNLALEGVTLTKLALRQNMVSEKEIEEVMKSKYYQRSVSEILCELSLITISELNLIFQKHNKKPKLGEILYQLGVINKTILDGALREQKRTRESLGNIFVKQNSIAVDQLYFALSIQYNIPFRELDDFVFDEKQRLVLRDILGQKFAEENTVLPLFLNGDHLTVAVYNPSQTDVIDKLKNTLKHYRVTCVLIRDEKFEQLFTLLYGEMLDAYRTLEIGPLQKNSSNSTFVISNPETDSVQIDDLYKTYETLNHKIGNSVSSSSGLLFKEFIEESYMRICDQFHCDSMRIYIESLKNRVEILAAPMVENLRDPEL